MPACAGLADPREQPELDAQVDEPRAVEAAEARDQVVEAVVVAHGLDCRMGPPAGRGASGVPWLSCNGCGARRGSREMMDADDRLTTALADDLDGAFDALVVAHQDRLYTIAAADARRCRATPRRPPRTRWSARIARWPRTTRPRIRELRLRGLADDDRPQPVSIGRRATRDPRARPVSIDGDPDATRPEPEAPAAGGSAEVAERHAERDRWAARLAALPPPYRAAVVLRHVDGMSYPEAAAALGRPEGTVKAQVHRAIALLRTMLEAESRREPEEMTA